LIFTTNSVIIESMTTEVNLNAVTRSSIFAALADPGRLAIVDRLLLGDVSPTEIQLLMSMPSNLVAHHVRVLEKADIVRRVRSEGDRRRTYLRINTDTLEAIVPAVARKTHRVVFVCTQNSARSQLAAAIWNRRSSVPAASAGTQPAPEIHPEALAVARRRNLPMEPRTPRHLDDVGTPDDLIIAVCDNAHEELPTDLSRIHWSIPDPVRSSLADAFERAFDELAQRIDYLAPRLQPI
jgi:ArsR family transcriptional regulator, arsenate/arsenite/antimonite-responsive transcriptional repressor / arsenate reductase (thioredoxin)